MLHDRHRSSVRFLNGESHLRNLSLGLTSGRVKVLTKETPIPFTEHRSSQGTILRRSAEYLSVRITVGQTKRVVIVQVVENHSVP